MKKLLGVLAVLLMVTPALANPLVEITMAEWDGDLMYFDLVMEDNLGMTDTIGGFGAMATISGADASRFASHPSAVRYQTGADMTTMVGPASYAWANFDMKVVANAPAANQMAFGQNADEASLHVALNTIAPGTVLARFVFELQDPLGPPVTEVFAHISSYADVIDAAVFTDSDAMPIEGVTSNDGLNVIPEPATMALLGLGLLGLVIRRKR